MLADPKRVKEIFMAVSEAADGRTAILDRECAGDADLRERVEALLRAHEAPASFLRQRPESTAAYRPPHGLRPGETFAGRFKLREELGHGGMGVVFVADQTEPVQRRVALKVIREGPDSARMLARFEQERQALALMDHPHIAKVFDAGVSDTGQPYFVMELIKGMPVTDYCDKAKLTPRERLELFVPVCHAVQHAHQKGVIHRDLKPSNILVGLYDGKPVPKVIDFGVAKATGQRLTEASVYTEVGAVIGTLEYMSPEQAELNNLDIDTRSDIYALGVILYQLLTGTVPFTRQELQAGGLAEMLRIIKEKEPPRPSNRLSTSRELPSVADLRRTEPSKLSKLVRGELDWIVMRALEKDRTRRYDTATALAKDVQKYLAGDAVEACPPTVGYRLRKAYRKNRAAILAAGAFAAVLLLGILGTTWGMVWALKAERDATGDRDAAVKAQANATASADLAVKAGDEAAAERDKTKAALDVVQGEQERIRRLLYASEMASASFALADGRGESVLQVLRQTTPKPGEPDLRGWEWHCLNRLYTSNVRELRLGAPLPDDNSQGANLALGARTVVTRYDAKSIWFEVFDTATGKQVGRIPKEGPLPGWDTPTMNAAAGGPGRPQTRYSTIVPSGVLDPGGRYLAALFHGTRVRLWRVDTGAELTDLPNEKATDAFSLTVGPDAAWIAWLDTAVKPRFGQPPPPNTAVTFRRWDRAKETLTSRTFTPVVPRGLRITADGWHVLYDLGGWTQKENNNVPPLKCWDVAADPPTVTDITMPDSRSGSTAVSADGAFVAIQADRELVVKSLPDGNIFWHHTLASTPGGREAGDGNVVGISDDGRRVVFTGQMVLAVFEKSDPANPAPPRGWVVRDQRLRTDGALARALTSVRPHNDPRSITERLSPDGRTFFQHTGFGTTVLSFDLSDDPQWAGPASRPQRIVEDLRGGQWSVMDADRKEIGRVTHPASFFPVKDRWIVLNPTPFGKQPGAALTWECFDTADPKELRLVATGEGHAIITPDGRWLLGRNQQRPPRMIGGGGGGGAGRYLAAYWTTTTVHNPETGKVVSRIEAPQGMVFRTFNPEPGGDLAAAVSFPTPSPDQIDPRTADGLPTKPVSLTLRLYEIGTGRERWAKGLGTGWPGITGPIFSRDKRRVFVATRDGDQGHVRVYNLADGSLERSFAVPTLVAPFLTGETGDGQLIFATRSSVEVWNPATGTRTHGLTGMDPNAHLQTASSPDGKRLFAVAHVNTTNSTRLHVWDLTTGREVLNLPLRNADTRTFRPPPEFADGKLRYSSTDGARVLDGTPLPEPAK